MHAPVGIDIQRTCCEQCRDGLHSLSQIHLEVDPPGRQIAVDDPDWILRLRKVLLHVLAISYWEISSDIAHVLAVELRAAFEQMAAVEDSLPEEVRLDEIDANWWAKEAKSGLLATYDHPTPARLTCPFAEGGFGELEKQTGYLGLVGPMCILGGGYGTAIGYLAQVLGVEGDIEQRVTAAMTRLSNGMSVMTLRADL